MFGRGGVVSIDATGEMEEMFRPPIHFGHEEYTLKSEVDVMGDLRQRQLEERLHRQKLYRHHMVNTEMDFPRWLNLAMNALDQNAIDRYKKKLDADSAQVEMEIVHGIEDGSIDAKMDARTGFLARRLSQFGELRGLQDLDKLKDVSNKIEKNFRTSV